jgi:hypothetical protein
MKKCIKNYSKRLTKRKYKLLKEYSSKYNRCKNLFYNMYWNRPDIIFLPYKFQVRDNIVNSLKNKELSTEQYMLLLGMPAKG